MITAIIDHPRGPYPKWPRVIEEETQADFDARIRNIRSGILGRRGEKAANELTVKIVLESGDISGRYQEPAE